jgi:hypothetical protein
MKTDYSNVLFKQKGELIKSILCLDFQSTPIMDGLINPLIVTGIL